MLADKKKDLIMFPYPQTVNLSRGQRSSAVRTVRDTSLTRPDEYVITMTEQLTELRSASDSGFFYAEKTLRELPPDEHTEILINPSGRFVEGGFEADTGLTGR